MQGTNRIYEEPSRLSQGLVIGLSIAVVLMGGWLTVTILSSNAATTAAEADMDAVASTPAPAKAMVSSAPDEPRETEIARSNSVHFDWPEEFSSPTPAPQRTALPLAPELPVTRDLGHIPWPAATAPPDARNRSPAARQPAGAATEATDASAGGLAPRQRGAAQHWAAGRETAAAAAPPPRPVSPRRQKPRVESDAGQYTADPPSSDPAAPAAVIPR